MPLRQQAEADAARLLRGSRGGDRSGGAAAGDARPAEEARLASPHTPSPAEMSQLWRRHRRERGQALARHDTIGACFFLAVIIAVRGIVGVLPRSYDEWQGGALLALTGVLMLGEFGSGSPFLTNMRLGVAFLLKITAATSTFFQVFTTTLLQVGSVVPHAGLVTDIISQLLFFVGLYMKLTLRSSSILRPMSRKPVCVLITTSAQFWLGVVPPLLLSVRRETTAALEFAQRHGIPDSDRRVRMYTWLRRATSLTDPLAARSTACLVAAFAAWAAIAWQHLKHAYPA
ncbi:hypothetical protein C2E20_1612 [Micractinium conductrix]|uniref:Uncharacterized protein n=1 Tax=Micractinium conductrix TaxID=554055 RepID=A0A2P6VMP4_9CHLO|nr:hypothetical protein C2E20_1612 [Micractinium conductrix]|eukprot:PSC75353.1 hypothetical protein C2E20_1612 [Micractinium conductrix]